MSPEQTLLAFFGKMNEWELKCMDREMQCDAGIMDYSDSSALGEKEYLDIYREFIKKDKVPVRDYQFSDPPDYDPARELITRDKMLGDDVVEIETNVRGGIERSHVYCLVKDRDRWLIAAKWCIGHSGDRIKATV